LGVGARFEIAIRAIGLVHSLLGVVYHVLRTRMLHAKLGVHYLDRLDAAPDDITEYEFQRIRNPTQESSVRWS